MPSAVGWRTDRGVIGSGGVVTDVTLLGTGRVGCDVARLIAKREGVRIDSACSRNRELVGRDLGELAGGSASGVLIQPDLESALLTPSDVVVQASASFLADVAPDIRTAIEARRNVLTTSEEGAFPWANDEALADELSSLATSRGVSVLGAGVNPGFVFDALVLTAAGAAWNIDRVAVDRTVGIALFSAAILRRSGVGFSPDAFERAVGRGAITGHIGLPQSMHLVAHGLGRPLGRIEGSIEPWIAAERFEGPHMEVEPGQTAGFTQEYRAVGEDGEPWFVARMFAHMNPPAVGRPIRDSIEIDGEAPVRLVTDPGADAQTTVAAVLVNSLKRVIDAAPGWRTVAELPPARPVDQKSERKDRR